MMLLQLTVLSLGTKLLLLRRKARKVHIIRHLLGGTWPIINGHVLKIKWH